MPPADHDDVGSRGQHADPVNLRMRYPMATKPQVNADSAKDEDRRKNQQPATGTDQQPGETGRHIIPLKPRDRYKSAECCDSTYQDANRSKVMVCSLQMANGSSAAGLVSPDGMGRRFRL